MHRTLDPTKPVLVTGGAGFIGSHVCDALLAEGFTVRCLDDLSTGSRSNLAHLGGREGFGLVEADIRSVEAVRQAMAGVGTVVHLAALGSVPRSIAAPLATHAVNLTGFLHVLEQARQEGVRRFIFASSSSVYGDSPDLPKVEDRTGRPLSPYAVTKAADESYADVYHRLYGMETIGLRFFNVFGERQDPEGPYAAAIPRFIRSLLRHEPPTIHGDGLQSRDFTYVANAVQAVQAAMRTNAEACFGQVFNVACGERTTVLELIEVLRAELARIDPAVAGVGVVHGTARQGDVRDSLADVSKARDLLGFTAPVDLRQGLQRAVPWYARHWLSLPGDP